MHFTNTAQLDQPGPTRRQAAAKHNVIVQQEAEEHKHSKRSNRQGQREVKRQKACSQAIENILPRDPFQTVWPVILRGFQRQRAGEFKVAQAFEVGRK